MQKLDLSREILLVENKCLVRLQRKRKVDADFQAAKEKQNLYSKLFVTHSNLDSNFFLTYILWIYNFSAFY